MTTPEQLREEAARHEREAAESFDRCDTDGFLSQWASGLSAQRARLQAEILENGGMAEFVGLYDRHGNRVKARLVRVYDQFKYRDVMKWVVLDEHDRAMHWVSSTTAPVGTQPSARSRMGQLGLHEEWEQAPATARIAGTGTGLSGQAWATVQRTDGGYPPEAKVHRTLIPVSDQ